MPVARFQLPDGRIARFEVPEGTTPEQAQEMIAAELPSLDQPKPTKIEQPKERGYGEELWRQLGLTGRAAIQGVSSIPNMFGNAVAGLYNAASGAMGYDSRLPSSTQSLNGLLDKFLPTPETKIEKVAQDITTGLGSAGGAAATASRLAGVSPAVRSFFGDNLGAQATAAAAGAGAAGTARESGADPSTQLGLGLIAGTVAPASSTAALTAAKLPIALAGQFTKSGRESSVGAILNQLAEAPARTISRLRGDIPEYVPGSIPTAGQASMDRGLMAAENFVKGLGTTTRSRFANATSANNAARQKLLEEVAGTNPAAIAAAKVDRNTVTKPMRDAAFQNANPVSLSPVDDAIANVMSGATGARQDVENAVGWVQKRLEKMGDSAMIPQHLYELRKDIVNNLIRGKYDKDAPGASLARKELGQIVKAIDDSLESAAPGFKDYMNTYKSMSRPITRMQGAQDLRYKATDTVIDETTGFATISQPKWEQRLGKLLEDEDFVKSLDPKHADALTRISLDLNRAAQSNSNPMRLSGSDTFSNMSTFGVLAKVLGGADASSKNIKSFADKFAWMTKLTERETNELLADALLDPKLALRLMQKANPLTAQSVSNTLKQRAKLSGYGQMSALD